MKYSGSYSSNTIQTTCLLDPDSFELISTLFIYGNLFEIFQNIIKQKIKLNEYKNLKISFKFFLNKNLMKKYRIKKGTIIFKKGSKKYNSSISMGFIVFVTTVLRVIELL